MRFDYYNAYFCALYMNLKSLKILCFAWTLLLFSCDQQEKVRVIPVNDFFKAQEKFSYKVSPDGKYYSYLRQDANNSVLVVEEVDGGVGKEIANSGGIGSFFYAWASNDELIYYKELNAGERQRNLFINSKDGTNERQLTKNEKSRFQILDEQLIDDKYLLFASNRRDSAVLDVYRLNVRDGKVEMAAKNPGNISRWITDRSGKLRMAISTDGVNETLLYRSTEQLSFKPIQTNSITTTIKPVVFSESNPNIIYAISNAGRDKNALVEIDCNTGKETNVLFEVDSLNVVDAQYSKTRKKMAFVVSETWKRQKHFLDAEVENLYKKLDELLPNTEIRISDRNVNDDVLIVRTFTDKNPGSYYLFFVNEGRIRKLGDFNPSIHETEMSDMEPIRFVSRDGVNLEGYLTLPLHKNPKKLPLIVLPHGGIGSRNSWGYNAEVQFFANRGYAVLQVNFRGSGGYGKKFYLSGFRQMGLKINDDIEDGVKWLVKEGVVDAKNVAIYGSGFGGFIALSSTYRNPGTYAAVASNSGTLNMYSFLKSLPPIYNVNLKFVHDMYGNPAEDNVYMNDVSPIFQADKIKVPAFIYVNTKDSRANPGDAIQFVKQLRKNKNSVTFVENQDPPFSPRRNENRQKLYAALEDFLSKHLNNK